jgi:hypothetical protein
MYRKRSCPRKRLTGPGFLAQTRVMARNAATLSLTIPLPSRTILDHRSPPRPADDDPLEGARACPSVAALVGASIALGDLTPSDLRPA